MPINANIPLQFQLPQVRSPLEAQNRLLSLQNLRQQNRLGEIQVSQADTAMQEHEAVKEAIRRAGSVEKALPEIMRVSPQLGLKLQESVTRGSKLTAEEKKAILELNFTKAEGFGRLASGIRDQASYEQKIQEAVQNRFLDPETAQQRLSQPYDPATVEGWKQQSLTMAQQIKAAQEKLDYEERVRHNQAIETKPPAEVAEFESWYKDYREANNLPDSPKTRFEARKQYRTESRPSKLLTPEEFAQQKALRPVQTTTIQTVDDKGNPVTKIVPKVAGSEFKAAPTADMRNKEFARGKLVPAIDQFKALSQRVITEKSAIVQRAKASGRAVEAALANDPDYRVYQDSRKALAGAFATAQQGSRVSDTDVMSIWLPMVPDVFRDTTASAELKWKLINSTLGIDETAAPQQGGSKWDKYPEVK